MSERIVPLGYSLFLVNAAHPMPAQPLSAQLEQVPGTNGAVLLERTAARALRGLVSSAGGDGLVLAVSGFRSREEQAAIWDEAVAERRSRTISSDRAFRPRASGASSGGTPPASDSSSATVQGRSP